MAVREYIGARYVPRFMGTWNNTTAYEALDVVDDGLGTSYTSKIPVPAGTPLTDPTYWAVTGSMSGAIISLQNRVTDLENIFATPQKYGAAGDGLTDDTAAFNSAMASGMNVYVPDGEYVISDFVNIPSNIIIFGSGVIKDASGATLNINDHHRGGIFNISSKSNVVIDGLRFEGSGALSGNANHGCSIYAENSDNIKVLNCEFYNIDKGYAICFLSSDHCKALDNYIHEYTYSGIACLNGCSDIDISGNTVYDCQGQTANHCYPITGSGHDFTITGPVAEAYNIKVTDNYIENLFPWWEGIDFHGGINVEICNNIVKGCYAGISAFSDDNNYYNLEKAIISGNILIGSSIGTTQTWTNGGINVTRAKHVTISDNDISLFGLLTDTLHQRRAIGIAICDDVLCSGNNIHDNGGSDGTGSVFYISAATHVSVQDNKAKDNNFLYFAGFYGACNNVYVKNNLSIASGHLANGSSLTDNKPNNNKVSGNESDDTICQSAKYYVPQGVLEGTPVTNMEAGNVGDIVYNRAPAVGHPIGWICTAAEAVGTPATWTALPNL